MRVYALWRYAYDMMLLLLLPTDAAIFVAMPCCWPCHAVAYYTCSMPLRLLPRLPLRHARWRVDARERAAAYAMLRPF